MSCVACCQAVVLSSAKICVICGSMFFGSVNTIRIRFVAVWESFVGRAGGIGVPCGSVPRAAGRARRHWSGVPWPHCERQRRRSRRALSPAEHSGLWHEGAKSGPSTRRALSNQNAEKPVAVPVGKAARGSVASSREEAPADGLSAKGFRFLQCACSFSRRMAPRNLSKA